MRFAFPSCVLLACLATTTSGWTSYEVWGSDQSNSVADQTALGVNGSWLWIWDETDVKHAITSGTTPASKSCSPHAKEGPCNMNDIFPGTLCDSDSVSGSCDSLDSTTGFGRWHGITKDPQNMYVTANIFAPGGGYLGVVDTTTKGAVALFRVTKMTFSAPTGDNPDATTSTRNVHMSFWNYDGSAILIHNLAGKAVERINVERDRHGKIVALTFDKSATVGLGKNMQVAKDASFFVGDNAFGEPLLGGVTGSYDDADLGDLTPLGSCKENGCTAGTNAGRPNNVPICPVMAENGLVFNTLGGGGLIVLDSTKTPMTTVGAYGNSVVYGAGVCGESVAGKVYFTSGNSASGAGFDQSMWALFAFDPDKFKGKVSKENTPAPSFFFDFPGTATGGRTEGQPSDNSGEVPGTTTRRDAHDLAGTMDGKYIHVLDRIKNVVDVFETKTDKLVNTYDLTTATGVEGDGSVGPCAAASITDGGDGFPINDPTPDFIDRTPDGKYMMLSLRGPAPVTAGHSAQGSCPGVGIVELLDGGASGKMVGVLRSVNKTPDQLGDVTVPAGVVYPGEERADVHDVVVVFKSGKKRSAKRSKYHSNRL